MKPEFYSLIILLILVNQTHNASFNLQQTGKHGGLMKSILCNKDTIIDFGLSPSTTITCPTGSSTCTTDAAYMSSVRFLDVGGSEEQYTLQANGAFIYAITASTGSRPQQTGLIRLKFVSSSGKILNVGIPFTTAPAATVYQNYEINAAAVTDTAFNTLKSLTTVTSVPLSAFNFLNKRDYGHFYHLANSAGSPTQTYLLSYFILSNLAITGLSVSAYDFPPSTFSTTDAYSQTGDKLCWGSGSEGIFQTHLRESYPLWTAWIGILFYWLYILLTESNEISCYDKKFENNKWTCWGFFSLHYLGHEEYFTKLSRTTMMLITFSWEGCVLGILYYNISPGQGPVMILWAGLIATVTAMPFTYVMGYVFLRKIYSLTLHKYDTLKEMKGVFNKKDSKMDVLEKSIDDTEESLYGYYYWFYVLAFCFFSAFWVIGVHEMMQIHRDNYYLMYHWLASMGVALGFEHLFFDPLLTFILGNTTFYRIRGFYYDFRLGERFKQIEE